MLSRWFLLVLACRVAGVLSLPATYDQRQTGDLNVQIHLKDVQVLALLDTELLDDYTEYDYIYDYADFTVKPIKPITSSTTTEASSEGSETTEKVEATETIDSSSENSTLVPANSESSTAESTSGNADLLPQVDNETANETSSTLVTEQPEDSSGENSTQKTRINDKTRKVFEDNDEDLKEWSVEKSSTESRTRRVSGKRCRTGYSPDGRGRCRRLSQRRVSLIPLAMRLGPKLLDNLAHSASNLAQEEVHLGAL